VSDRWLGAEVAMELAHAIMRRFRAATWWRVRHYVPGDGSVQEMRLASELVMVVPITDVTKDLRLQWSQRWLNQLCTNFRQYPIDAIGNECGEEDP
jgi:hypothetical protein